MVQSETSDRRGFFYWLRTGRRRVAPDGTPLEFKFNPYHDPRNGQFTFAPGGPRSLDRVIVSHRGERAKSVRQVNLRGVRETRDIAAAHSKERIEPAVYRPEENNVRLEPASSGNRPPPQRGSNIAAFRDPMTLEQVFPGLRDACGGSILALADNMFGFSAPARALTSELALNKINTIIRQIQAVDPTYRLASLGFH